MASSTTASLSDSRQSSSTGAKIGAFVVTVLFLFWGGWRWFIVAGGPWKAGHSCGSLVSCRDGLCLVHQRVAATRALLGTAGYCSTQCQADADCPADMACEALPEGISRKEGDHLPLIKLPERLCVRIVR